MDAAERVLVTYLEAFFALLITDGFNLTDLGAVIVLKLAAIAKVIVCRPCGCQAVIASAVGTGLITRCGLGQSDLPVRLPNSKP